jgi:excisionase family DNA binding protein
VVQPQSSGRHVVQGEVIEISPGGTRSGYARCPSLSWFAMLGAVCLACRTVCTVGPGCVTLALTPAQVAQRLRVSTETIRCLCREHQLKAIRIGRQRSIR